MLNLFTPRSLLVSILYITLITVYQMVNKLKINNKNLHDIGSITLNYKFLLVFEVHSARLFVIIDGSIQYGSGKWYPSTHLKGHRCVIMKECFAFFLLLLQLTYIQTWICVYVCIIYHTFLMYVYLFFFLFLYLF